MRLVAHYEVEKGALGGPESIRLLYDAAFGTTTIEVEQGPSREISVTFQSISHLDEAFRVIETTEQLIMLCDGRYIPLKSLRLACTDGSHEDCQERCDNLLRGRLSFYRSADFLAGTSKNKLLDYSKVLNDGLIARFQQLRDDMGIVFNVLMYAQGGGLLCDVRVAFAVELAEPMVELCKTRTGRFQSLNPGSRGTTLADCVTALIVQFGRDLFADEIESDLSAFVNKAKNSRVRIMHIKNGFDGKSFSPSENICYSALLLALYRRILLELLGLSDEISQERLAEIAKYWKGWLKKREVEW